MNLMVFTGQGKKLYRGEPGVGFRVSLVKRVVQLLCHCLYFVRF